MKIYLDSADINEFKQAPFVNGYTTNPTLLAKSKANLYDLAKLAGDKPISFEVISNNPREMLKEASDLITLGKNVVVKLPCTHEALQLIPQIKASVNVTLVFTPLQTLMAAKAGASYVSVFVGRLEDAGELPEVVLNDTKQILDNHHNYLDKPKIIAASIRNLEHLQMVAQLNIDIATVPFKVYQDMFKHPLTDKGLEKFLKDAKNIL